MEENKIKGKPTTMVESVLGGANEKLRSGLEKLSPFSREEKSLNGSNNSSNNSQNNSSNSSKQDKTNDVAHNKSPLINDEFAPNGTNPISDYSTEGLNNKLTSDELEGVKEHNEKNGANISGMDNKTAGQKSLLSRLENAKAKATTPRDIERITQLQDTIKDAFSENGSLMTEKAFSEVKGYINSPSTRHHG